MVGTNSRDYAVAHGLSSFAVGTMSDGLVRIQNAYVDDAPRAFVKRSHSGYFGIVNSEEGYQNLVRFLFGNVRATGTLDINAIPFPPDIEAARKKGKKIESSYYIETTVAPRVLLALAVDEEQDGTPPRPVTRISILYDGYASNIDEMPREPDDAERPCSRHLSPAHDCPSRAPRVRPRRPLPHRA